jgi:hypothetical protein
MHQAHTGVIQSHELNDEGGDQAYFIGDVQKAGSKTSSGFRSNPGVGVLEFEICLLIFECSILLMQQRTNVTAAATASMLCVQCIK